MMRVLLLTVMLAAATCRADDLMLWDASVGQVDQVTRGLVGYWAMRVDGTNALNELASGQSGAPYNGAVNSYSYGVVGNGYWFDGTNDFLAFPDSANHTPDTDYSVSAWIKTSMAGQGYIFDKFNNSPGGADTGTSRGIFCDVNAGAFRMFVGDGTTSQNAASSVSVNDGAWHHVVGTYDGITILVYVDGVVRGSTACTRTPTPTTELLTIGANAEPLSVFNVLFQGYIDEVRLYQVVLSVEEIRRLYRMGSVIKGVR